MDAANQYFDNICRTCMHKMGATSSYADKQWHSIFDIISECDGLSIAELLSSIVPRIKVHQIDQLPKKVCLECLHQLKNSYSFHKMCLHADQQIQEMIANLNFDLNSFPQTTEPTSGNLLNTIERTTDGKNFEIDINEYVKIEPSMAAQTILPSILEVKDLSTKHVLASESISMSRYTVTDIGIEYTNNVSEKSQSSATDVQSNDEQIEYSKTAQVVVKNEICKEEEFIAESSIDSMRVITDPMDLPELEPKEKSPTNRNSLKCSICSRLFHTLESLTKHSLSHEEIIPTSVDSALRTDPELYQVKDCQTSSPAQNSLSISMPPKNYSCDLCQKLYSSQNSLQRHKCYYCKKNTEKKIKQYTCKVCKKTFDNRVGIERHKLIHTGERPYICPECGKSFVHSRTLTQHRLSHNEVKPFKCPVCPLKFYDSGNLSKHKEVHAGSKAHVCDVCGKRFARSYNLAIHKKYHSGEKSYKCDYCDMRFVIIYDQRRHMRYHTGEKPYKCKYCEEVFTQTGGLLYHLRVHLGKNVHRCELCPASFRFASELRIHFTTHKNDDKETRERNLKALKEAEAKLKKNC